MCDHNAIDPSGEGLLDDLICLVVVVYEFEHALRVVLPAPCHLF